MHYVLPLPYILVNGRDIDILHAFRRALLDWKFSKHTSYIQVLLFAASRSLTSLQVVFLSLDPRKWVIPNRKKNQLHLE